MYRSISRIASSLALFAAGFAAPAHATNTVINFDNIDPTLMFPGDSVEQGGFNVLDAFGYATIDRTVGLGDLAPTGNDTQFYATANNGSVWISRSDGGLFDLLGFDAAFIPRSIGAAGVKGGAILMVGYYADGTSLDLYGSYLALSGSDGRFPFSTLTAESFDDPTFTAAFSNVTSVNIVGCAMNAATGSCENNIDAQFALDNITVSAVPEPSTYALFGLGLAGLAWTQRRRSHRNAPHGGSAL